MEAGDGCAMTGMYLMPLNHTLESGKRGQFYTMCILAQNEKIFKCVYLKNKMITFENLKENNHQKI